MTLLHSEFTSYPNADFYVPLSLAQGGGTLGEKRPPNGAKGNPIPTAPDVSFNVGGTYSVPIGSGGLDLSANYAYTGKWFANADHILSEPAHGLLDASVTYKFPDDHFSVGV